MLFGSRQAIGVLGRDGSQLGVPQRICSVANGDCPPGKIDLIEKQTIIKLVFRSSPYQLSLQLELDQGDGLVHTGH